MIRAISILSAAAVALAACRPAAALDYQFSGNVTNVPVGLATEFTPGEIISGRLTIVPTEFLPHLGVRVGQITRFAANIGGDYPITAHQGRFEILNDFGGVIDMVKLEIIATFGMVAAPVAGYAPDQLYFLVLYDDTSQLTSDFLPQFILSNPTDSSGLRFDLNGGESVDFRLTDLSLVPEPSALLLAVPLIALLAAFRRTRVVNFPI
jgi:hypothetical protein